MSIVIRTSDNQTLTFEKEIIRVGCSERSDVRFSRDQVASEHAELQKIGGRWLIKSVSDDNVHVDGKPAGRMIWLQPGDSVRINSEGVGFVFQPPEPAVAARPGSGKSSSTKVTERTQAAATSEAAAAHPKHASLGPPPENREVSAAHQKVFKYGALSCLVMAVVAVGAVLLNRNGSSGDGNTTPKMAEGQPERFDAENMENQQAIGGSDVAAAREAGQPDQDAVVANRMQQVLARRLMIGYEINTERKLLGQVWALNPGSVVGSALLFDNLLKTPEQVQIFIHSSKAGDPVCYLDRDSIRIHSSFSMEDAATMHSAVAMAQPSKPLDCSALTDTADVLPEAELVEGLRIIHQGFGVPRIADKAALFDLTMPPPALQLEGQLSYVSPETPKVIRVKFPDWDSSGVILEGGFVTTATGQLAGTLVNGNAARKEFHLIPIERTEGLR